MKRDFRLDSSGDCLEARKIIAEFVAKKSRQALYSVQVKTDEDELVDGGYPYYMIPLTHEEREALLFLKAKYGNGDYLNHVEECAELADAREDFPFDQQIVDLDIDHPVYHYSYSRHFLTDKGLKTELSSIEIGDESYIRLLYQGIFSNGPVLNELAWSDTGLYDVINGAIIRDTYNTEVPTSQYTQFPFLVTLDEAVEDVNAILDANLDLRKFVSSSTLR